MPMNLETRQKSTVSVDVKFASGDELKIQTRSTGHSFGTLKQMINDNREATRVMRRVALLKRELDRMPLPDVPKLEAGATVEQKTAVETAKAACDDVVLARVPIEEEIDTLEAKAFAVVDVMIDWFVGDEQHPGAVADWDYFVDASQTEKVPITREYLEGLLPAEIIEIGSRLFASMQVDPQSPPG